MSADSLVNGKPHGPTPLFFSLFPSLVSSAVSFAPFSIRQCDSNGIKRTFLSPRPCATASIARLHADNRGTLAKRSRSGTPPFNYALKRLVVGRQVGRSVGWYRAVVKAECILTSVLADSGLRTSWLLLSPSANMDMKGWAFAFQDLRSPAVFPSDCDSGIWLR